VYNCNVYWATDSTNLVSFLSKGSKKREVQKLLFEAVEISHQLRVNIIPIHLYREDPRIQEANEGSKMADSDDCSISFEDWKWFEAFDLKVDLFADHLNTRSSHFCAQYYSPEVWAIDAFSIS